MSRRVLMILGFAALALSGCDGGSAYGYYNDPFYDPWDNDFRYGIYDVHDDVSIDIERPRPPPSARPPRPAHPISGVERPSRPAGGRGGRSLR